MAFVSVFGLMVEAVLPLPITMAAASVVLEAAEEPEPEADPCVVPDADSDDEPLGIELDPEGEAELPAWVAEEAGVEEGPLVVDDGAEVGVLEGEALVGVEV